MKLPPSANSSSHASSSNPYSLSAVSSPTGFANTRGGFLIQHGTGDDNVHFQNSAVMVDMLTYGGISPDKMHVQWFTDSDHSISWHGAGGLVYKQMALYLLGEKRRVEGEERGEGLAFEKRGKVVVERFEGGLRRLE